MGLYDAMNASVTGMNAQSNYLSNIGQNISNSSSVGYKQADTEFSTLVNSPGVGQTASGGVTTTTRLLVDKQGTLTNTTSVTDLAVSGNGMFVVSDNATGAGQNYLSRAGSFVPDNDGNLVNAAGYYLMGYDLTKNPNPTMSSNSLTGMETVKVGSGTLPANPTTTGSFVANLPSTDTKLGTPVVPGTPPAAPTPATGLPAAVTPLKTTGNYSEKTSIVMYDNLGSKQTIDLYFQNNGPVYDSHSNLTGYQWTVAAFDSNGNQIDTGTSTPLCLNFDTQGNLKGVDVSGGTGTTKTLSIAVPNGATMALDFTGMTQNANSYSVAKSAVGGNAASSISKVTIDKTGTLSYQLADGSTVSGWKIPLASVPSPDSLLASSGNVFSPNILSGQATLGVAGTGSLGTIKSSQLEQSTVDVSTELTNMIVAQRNYQANSKVFSTSAQLMDTLVNLQV